MMEAATGVWEPWLKEYKQALPVCGTEGDCRRGMWHVGGGRVEKVEAKENVGRTEIQQGRNRQFEGRR